MQPLHHSSLLTAYSLPRTHMTSALTFWYSLQPHTPPTFMHSHSIGLRWFSCQYHLILAYYVFPEFSASANHLQKCTYTVLHSYVVLRKYSPTRLNVTDVAITTSIPTVHPIVCFVHSNFHGITMILQSLLILNKNILRERGSMFTQPVLCVPIK